MKKENIIEHGKKIVILLVSAFLYALCVKLIIQPNKFLSGGVSGFTIYLSRIISIKMDDAALESTLYSIFYIIFNIPIFIFGFNKIGKQFIVYSLFHVIISSILVSVIPSTWQTAFQLDQIDLLTSAIIAGILQSISSVLAFTFGYSQGGADIISMYLSRTKGKGIGSYSFAINVFILVISGITFKNYSALIYTIIYFFTSSLMLNNLYIGHKKTMIEIVSSKPEEMSQKLMEVSHHGCTILDAYGAYSKQTKKIIRIVVASNQVKSICEIIKSIDEGSFATLSDIKQVNGRFYIPPMK